LSNPPTVTVIMAVYNEADRLPATLESIRQQTFKDFETIIVDDGSTDSTWRILSEFDHPLLRIHRNIPHKGLTHSLNYALSMARGKYIARHDAQDISTPDRFQKQARYLDSHPKVAAVGAQVDWIDASGAVIHHIEYPTANADITKRLESENALPHGAVMIRKSALDAAEGYRETFRLAPDYDLWLRLAKKHQFANLPETLYRLQFSPGMVSVSRRAEHEAYSALAGQLAAERRQHESEQTDVEQAAAAIRQRYEEANVFSRRSQQAQDYLEWAERLAEWGEPASRYVWPLTTQALLTWPFSPRAWQFAFRQFSGSSRVPAS
jgi:glycosyltransferase involved in cell wall biosynthesis